VFCPTLGEVPVVFIVDSIESISETNN
jgi:hypothetical protein